MPTFGKLSFCDIRFFVCFQFFVCFIKEKQTRREALTLLCFVVSCSVIRVW